MKNCVLHYHSSYFYLLYYYFLNLIYLFCFLCTIYHYRSESFPCTLWKQINLYFYLHASAMLRPAGSFQNCHIRTFLVTFDDLTNKTQPLLFFPPTCSVCLRGSTYISTGFLYNPETGSGVKWQTQQSFPRLPSPYPLPPVFGSFFTGCSLSQLFPVRHYMKKWGKKRRLLS